MPFNRPTLPELIQRQQADIESRLAGSDPRLRVALLNALGNSNAGVVHGIYGNLEWLAKQIIPDTADVDILERHASWWGVKRNKATQATGIITITGTDTSVVPTGTTWQRSDGFEFTTDTEVTITGGSITVAVTAVLAGKNGNTVVNSSLTIVSPLPGVNSTATVDVNGLSRGIDIESPDQLLNHLHERVRRTPTGGNKDDYVLWALEVPGVTRVWVYDQELGIGTVTVRFMMDNTYADGVPQAADVQAVHDHIDTVRPLGMKGFYAVPPIATPLNLTIQIAPNTAAVRAAVQSELQDVLQREAKPGGIILLSHINEAIAKAVGENDHILVSPVANVTHTTGQIPTLGIITWQAL